jgi:hypothetical protein
MPYHDDDGNVAAKPSHVWRWPHRGCCRAGALMSSALRTSRERAATTALPAMPASRALERAVPAVVASWGPLFVRGSQTEAFAMYGNSRNVALRHPCHMLSARGRSGNRFEPSR